MNSRFWPYASFWRGRRIFLTGHTGFKGSWLSVWLTELGAEVRGYALAPSTVPSAFTALGLAQSMDSVIADIRDADRLRDSMRSFAPEIAIHMAAQPLVRRSYRDPLDTLSTNIQGTANFLEACRTVPQLRSILVVTSDKCYENFERPEPYHEGEKLGGHDPYSASKACAEIIVDAYRRSYFSSGSDPVVASGRAGNVFGGGDWSEDRLVPDAARAFAAGRQLVVRNPDATRPWQHVVEPLLGYLMLTAALTQEGSKYARAFNFGPPPSRSYSVRTIADILCKAWGPSASWRSEVLDKQPHEARMLTLDSRLAYRELGWDPDVDPTLAADATARWYRAFHDGISPSDLRRETWAMIQSLLNPALLKTGT